MTTLPDIDSLDRLISNAGLGSFELGHPRPPRAPATVAAKPPPRRISQDFLCDLDLAGRHVMQAFTDAVQDDKGCARLMTALDGHSSDNRAPADFKNIANLLLRFVQGDDALCFVPALRSDAPGSIKGVHTLPSECTSALSGDLGTVFCSADLGFRDLFQVTQMACIKALILRSQPIGRLQDPAKALGEIATLFQADGCEGTAQMQITDITLGTPHGPRLGYGTTFVTDT